MRESSAWFIQARSDLKAARKLARDPMPHDVYCQVAAKAQQTVEKSIKALQAALFDAKLITESVGQSHSVSQMASGIRNGSQHWPKVRKGERDKVRDIVDPHLKTIKELDSIVPRYPAANQLPTKNSEYPFRTAWGGNAWRAPAEEGVFSKKDVDRYLKCAQKVQVATEKVVVALELAYP